MTPRRKLNKPGLFAVLALSAAIALAGAVSGSASEPVAVAAKKKCKKSRWKCAPKVYHLSASGTNTGSKGSEVWSAEVDLGKRRASVGTVDYSQDGGKVTVSGQGTLSFNDNCIEPGEPSYVVPQQTLSVPHAGVYGSDFGVTFHLRVNGVGKNEYGLGVGAPQSEFSNVKGTATVTCPEGTSFTQEYAYVGLIHLRTALVERAKVGDSPLRGSVQSGGYSVTWKLTAQK